jgi:hypothetical protein
MSAESLIASYEAMEALLGPGDDGFMGDAVAVCREYVKLADATPITVEWLVETGWEKPPRLGLYEKGRVQLAGFSNGWHVRIAGDWERFGGTRGQVTMLLIVFS